MRINSLKSWLFFSALCALGAAEKAWAVGAPTAPAIQMTHISSMTTTWGDPGGTNGFDVQVSTDPNFTGAIFSSSTIDASATTLQVVGLSPNTVYSVQVGAIYGGATTYALTAPTTASTLADAITNAQVLQVLSTSATVGWTAFSSGSGANTAEDYRLEMSSTNFNGTGIVQSTSSAGNVALSTLTITSLLPATTYFVRLGAVNWNGVPNFISISSFVTTVPPIPSSLTGTASSPSSINWTFGAVSGASTYKLYQATSPVTLRGSNSSPSIVENGLSTNTAYGRVVTEVMNGVESSLSNSATVYTKAALPGNPVFSNVLFSSFTVSWSTNNPAGTPFEVTLSTNNFATIFSTPVPFPSFVGNTTSFVGLSTGTNYYVRIRAQNGDAIPTSFSATVSTITLSSGTLSTPSALAGTANSVTSIQWGWGLVSGATGYNLYLATAPVGSLIFVSTPTLSFLVSGLPANSPFGLKVQAVGGGLQSALSASATTYTWANLPTVPTLTNVGSSSFTVTWTTSSNPGYTPYQLEVAQNSGFTLNVSTPITFAANLTANTTTVIGLAGNTPYYVRIRAQNGNAIAAGPSPTANATTKPNATGGGGGSGTGAGTATLAPSSVPGGGVVTTTVTYIVPAAGMNAGGRLDITVPPGWWPTFLQNTNTTQDGYVAIVTTAAVSFNLTFSTSSAEVILAPLSAVNPLTAIKVVFNNMHPNCPVPGQTSVFWGIKSALTSADNLGDIASQPSQTFSPGQAQWVGYNPWTNLTVIAGQASQAITLQANDNCGLPVVLGSSLPVTLQGLLADGMTTDTSASFSTASNFSALVTSVTIPAASSTTVYFYKSSTVGNGLQIKGSYVSPVGGYSQQVWRPVQVLASGFSFGSTEVDNGAYIAGQKSITLSPDGSGINNFAYIRFIPTDNSIQWHVSISSTNFQTFVFERWGSGDPLSTLTWDGRSFNSTAAGSPNGPQTVPNGTYVVKIEVVGLTSDTSLSIVVNSAQITGHVTVGGSPVAGAQVNAQGMNSPGFSSAQTDGSGNYTLNGLRAGYQYNLYATYVNPANQSVVTGQLTSISAGATGQNFALTTPAVLRVAAVLSSSSPVTVFGSVNVHSSNYLLNYNGNLRLLAGTTTSDNGDPFNPSTWTVLYVQPGSYVIHPFLPGYGTTDIAVTASSDVVISLTPKASVYGLLTLPTPVTNSTWISVEGVLQGNNSPTVWGGVFFNAGQSVGVYTIYSVDAGVYTFRARPAGYIPASLTGITVAGVDIGNPSTGGLDFASGSFGTGGQITGTVTVNGDTSSQFNPFTLWISAYSPSLGSNVFTQVQLSTSVTSTSSAYQISGVANGAYQVFPPYLAGFETSPSGTQNVTVSAGSASLNLTLNQVTGRVTGSVTLPGGNSDYANVHMTLQGPYQRDVDLTSGPAYSLNNLGTGNYSLVTTYLTTGAQVRTSFLLTNGQTLTSNQDLSSITYGVTGNVSVQNAFSIRNSSNSLVTINTVTDLLASATNQTVTLGASVSGAMNTAGGVAAACSGGTPTVLSTVRIEAFPKQFGSYGNANRTTASNCFGVGQYKYGIIDSSGNYSISGLTPGVWEVSVYPYFDGGQIPNAAVTKQIITVVASTITGINFPLSNGYLVSGTVNLPSGLTDTRSFNAQILSPRGDFLQSAAVAITGAGSVAYQFTGLPSGSYGLIIQDMGTYDAVLNRNVIKYVSKPVQFTIAGADLTSVNVTMTRASSIVGKLLVQGGNPDGTAALTLITPNNQNLLSSNFRISANANPWVPGGYGQAEWGNSGSIFIDSNNQFHIDGLGAGTYDVIFKQDSFGLSVQGAGSLNIASLIKGSVQVGDSQTVDLGTVNLVPGISLSGTVTDSSGNGLANIPLEAQGANSKNGDDSIRVFTDTQGNFTLAGLSPGVKIYNLIAARRPSPNDSDSRPVPYGTVKKLAVDVTQVPPPTLTFVLPSAAAQLTGKIATVDSGALAYPESDNAGFPGAAVYVRPQGAINEDNPLGDVSATGLDGTFSIPYLPAGIYDITVESLGYRPARLTGVSLTNTTKDLGTITLQKGPSLEITLTKPDGSNVNTKDVRFAVSATADLSSIIFGQITSDANTSNITSIKFSGFELSPKTYSVLLFDNQDNIVTPVEGRGMTFSSNSDSVVKAMTYQPSAPFAFTHVRRSGSGVALTYYFSRPIRNRGDDQDPTQWFTLTSGSGVLSNHELSADRRQLTVLYTPAPAELNATLRFTAQTVDIDPATGVEFILSKSFTLLLGQKATAESNINSALGGSVSLSDNSDPSNVLVPSNALLASDGTQADASTSYAVTFTATDDATLIAASNSRRSVAAGVQALMSRGAAAYVSEAWLAMQSLLKENGLKAHTSSVDPFSSFYSVLLPAGISHTLNQSATLTLNYDTDADPTLINVYYFNGTEYLLESGNRTIDAVNHTIAVTVSHFSTFVVLQNSNPVVFVDGDSVTIGDIDVFNFPNPFDLKTKTLPLNHDPSGSGSMSTDGTIIRYNLPVVRAGAAHIDIYNVVGEKVRSIDLGVPATDTVHYVTWDGKNDSGNKVASGVYVGILKAGGTKKFWKMAVIK